ncbi:MAG: Xaa-Pro dipeptidase, partial [Pseudohongiellaceae bacterium]
QSVYAEALARTSCSGLLLHSGREQHYFGDDRSVPFQAFGHFLQWVPVNRPDQFLLIRPGERPRYFQVVPDDFWHDQHIDNADWWADALTITRLRSVDELAGELSPDGLCYLGDSPGLARDLGLAEESVNPEKLWRHLDYQRAVKSAYELDRLRTANRLALEGHRAAQESFLAGGSEFDIHMAYLGACRMQENDCPYTNIVAVNDKAAILHYQNKRTEPVAKSQVLLIDAGARVAGYGSDITRTTATTAAPTLFHDLLEGMDRLQQRLVGVIRPGLPYSSLHDDALKGVAELLLQLGLCHGTPDQLLEQHLPQLFMPHGVGHLLGIQVHDVGGHQADVEGRLLPPPDHSPALRTTRILEPDMVFTIEPGCYFIPLLLEPERNSDRGKAINWSLVDSLYACGGIRIEDNVRVTADGAENLTRQKFMQYQAGQL